MNNMEIKEKLFRQFQIDKFSLKKSVPTVSMTVDIYIDKLQQKRALMNSTLEKENKITLTHCFIKAVGEALYEFPELYSYFNGKKAIRNSSIKINLPVAEKNHVEYVVIENPHALPLENIVTQVTKEIKNIRNNTGKFYKEIIKLYKLPRFLRYFIHNNLNICIKTAAKNYGNFPLTNFGSFGVKNGTPVLSGPIVAALCIGSIETINSKQIIPITLVFDHRPIDGAYGGKFLNMLKDKVEESNFLIKENG